MKNSIMKNIITACFLFWAGTALWGQSGKLKRADNYYQRVAYAEAAQDYEGLLGSEYDGPKMKLKLATCYYKMDDYTKANDMFAQVLNAESDFSAEDIYTYAQSLKMAGKYKESDQWMNKYAAVKTEEVRVDLFKKQNDYYTRITSRPAHFELSTVDINTKYTDFGGYFQNDSTFYVISSRPSGRVINNIYTWNEEYFLDIYKVVKHHDGSYSKAKRISKKVNKRFHEGPLAFSPDGTRMYFSRNNYSKGKNRKDRQGIQLLKMYVADINSKGKFKNIREISLNNKDYSVGHPSVSPDGKQMYFTSTMPGGIGGADLYVADILENGDLANPKNLGAEINTEGQEMFPWINGDGNLYFASNGHIGLGGLDNYVAIYDPKKKSFKKVINCGLEINTPQDDFGLIFSGNSKTGFVSSNRENGKGKDDIYSFILVKPFATKLELEGVVRDLASKELIPEATVAMKNIRTGEIISTTADKDGAYSFELEEDQEYTFEIRKEEYFDGAGKLTTKGLDPSVELINKDFELEKDPGLALYALVTDKNSHQPIEGVKIRVLDNFTNKNFITANTPVTGDVKKGIEDKKIGDRLSYNIVLEKEGYLSKTVTFNHLIDKPGVVDVHLMLDLTMEKIDVGMDLAKIIDIKPIYFDLAKYNIRKDAAVELDKIVKVMNENPTMEIELGSHTDCRSSYAYNMKLSNQRAEASAEYIKKRISNPERIYGKGYGESRLLNDCGCEGPVKSTCSEEEHQLNRRTEFVIIKM